MSKALEMCQKKTNDLDALWAKRAKVKVLQVYVFSAQSAVVRAWICAKLCRLYGITLYLEMGKEK